MIQTAIVGLSLVGFALLFLAIPHHQQDWMRRKLSPSLARALRRSGFATLGLASVLAGTGLDWAYGALVWFGWLTLAAALVVAAHSNRERIRRTVRR
jgi:inner membrane protein involved in colicin E2 resistance